MDKYMEIKKRMVELAKSDSDIKLLVAIGSSTHDDGKNDEFSDLDVIISTDNVEKWYSGEYPALLGDVNISFIEPTLGEGKERRCIYGDDLDVDMLIFSPAQFDKALKEGVMEWVMNRGYEILYEASPCQELIQKFVKHGHSNPSISEEEFSNCVNNFYFHNIWAYKKLKRGELWSAKMCVDAYLKTHLLKMLEVYRSTAFGVDVYHDGRFIDEWAGEEISSELKKCFAHYEKDDVLLALQETSRLFEKVSRKIAEKQGFAYPEKALCTAWKYLSIR